MGFRRHEGQRARAGTIGRVVAVLGLLLGSLAYFAMGAAAVHDDDTFELDGNAVNQDKSADGIAGNDGDDWDVVYQGYTNGACNLPSPVVTCSFDHDAVNGSIFTTGGSKDELDLDQWRHTNGSVPDKDNLLDAFAVRYENDLLYFGADRSATNGDAQIGFWFFQDDVSLNADGTFSGRHTAPDATHPRGDILVLSNFTNGGGTPNIRVFEWLGSGNVQQLQGVPLDSKCLATLSNDPACAITSSGGETSPWTYDAKGGGPNPENAFANGAFYEGGIDLAFLGLADECFSSFLVETRSSQSISATLKDFVLGPLGNCSSGVTTEAQDAGGNAITTVSIGTGSVTVKDEASVSGSGTTSANPTGSVDFYLCGPSAGITSCDANGTAVSTEQLPGTANPGVVTSDPVTIRSVGDYCFFAEYSGDANFPGSGDDGENECFTVTPVEPSITTDASADPPTGVALGSAISDTATLSGTATQPDGDPAGGTITFNLYGPDDANCTGAVAYTNTVNVSGNGQYGSGSFTPTAAGTYRWVASYSGDAPNTLGDSGACNDVGEASLVISLTPTISTNQGWIPQDSATITVASGGGNLNGTVTFSLFDNATCSGTALYSESVGVSGALSKVVGTLNDGDSTDGDPGYTATASGTYRWLVSYSSSNPAHTNASHTCGAENSVLTITNG